MSETSEGIKKPQKRKTLTKEQFERAFELVGELQKLGIDTSSVTMHMCELAPDDEEEQHG